MRKVVKLRKIAFFFFLFALITVLFFIEVEKVKADDMPFSYSQLSTLPLTGEMRDVKISGNYAYIAAGSAGTHIIDISDLSNPILLRTVANPLSGTSHAVDINGDYLYVASGSAGIQVIDISNPASATEVSVNAVGEVTLDIVIEDGFLYIANRQNGVKVYSLTADPIPSGTTWCSNESGILATVPTPITERGSAGWAKCWDWCSSYGLDDTNVCQYNSDGDYNCWVSQAPGNDITNCTWVDGAPPYGASYITPTQSVELYPVYLGGLDTSYAKGIFVDSGKIFVADGFYPVTNSETKVISISNPESPSLLNNIVTQGDSPNVFF